MHMKRLGSLALMLGCVSAYAKAPEREVWITLGADAVTEVNAAFIVAGERVPALAGRQGDVVAMKLPESRIDLVSEVMHEKLKRCGGFLYHETEADALAELAIEGAPALAPSLAVTYSLDKAPVVNTLIGGMAATNIHANIEHLSTQFPTRYYTSTHGVAAATWVRDLWAGYAGARAQTGGDVTVELFTHALWAQPSVILTIQGTQQVPAGDEEIVVLGGHLDSTNLSGSAAPGADDNASGISTLSEVIRVAMASNYQPLRTVKFMAYAAEEVGLRGSKEIADKAKNEGDKVVGVLQLDMTNYKGSVADVVLMTDFTNAAQNAFIGSLISTYVAGVQQATSACGYGCSDHASWNAAGFAASIPFEAMMGQHNSTIHTANDTLAVSGNNANHALKFAKVAGAYMVELAKGTATLSDPVAPTVSLTAPSAGTTVSGTVTASANAQDNQGISRVEFLVDGAVVGTATTSPYSIAWNTAVIANGSHAVVARAYDLIGNTTDSAPVTVTTSNSSGNAIYDPVLRVPRCANVSNVCDSTTLLVGRASLGPEANGPNTVNNSCADGINGTFHFDESNDRIKVSTVSGNPFAAGETVLIEATVWALAARPDKLDLYHAPDASNPVWTKITTLAPPAGGQHTLSATFTLPAGANQVVRARFRKQGSATPCYAGAYDDHDDIVFAVSP
ncbi:M20/M25/M40 family metallo-hydrolase [Myxococcus sp. AS-1-15]|uniref:M20/M25/M40 family metallo-hydrolase n=1 Tax=Myxococcus sp. AS-1-15 TaxID=2874600 RepID=UPI001CC066DD|nr:M20/M25/M40 family metallo-hydrolase [Myxococcus sp. AS-1-15]MBZ4396678.1 M20/M25/M40 family metallo-hydrolase [Myxococcus sp. AS-1-15]